MGFNKQNSLGSGRGGFKSYVGFSTHGEIANNDGNYLVENLVLDRGGTWPFPRTDGTMGYIPAANELRAIGGWNPVDDFGVGVTKTNKQWESTDDGLNWTEITAASIDPMHWFCHGVNGSNFYIWGGDENTQRNTHRLNLSTEVWTETDADWGTSGSEPNSRLLMAWAVHKGYLYMAGGQVGKGVSEMIMYTDVWRTNDEGVTWTKIGDLPSGLDYFSAGQMISDGTNLFLIGGGRYNFFVSPIHDNYNTKVYKSTDDGATWSEIATLPSGMQAMYPSAFYFDKRYWYLHGHNGDSGGGNKQGLWYTKDFQTWNAIADETHATPAPPARHATGFIVDEPNNAAYFINGNFFNDIWRITYAPEDTFLSTRVPLKYAFGSTRMTAKKGAFGLIRRDDNDDQYNVGWDSDYNIRESEINAFIDSNIVYYDEVYDQTYDGATETDSTLILRNTGDDTTKVKYVDGCMFSDSNVRIIGTNKTLLGSTADFTWSLWIKSSTTNTNRAQLAWVNGGAVTFNLNDGAGMWFWWGNNANNKITFGTLGEFTDGNWHMLTARRTGTTIEILVDNVSKGTSTTNTSFSFNFNLILFKTLAGTGASFLGYIDDVTFSESSLSASELTDVYNTTGANKV